MSTRSGKEPCAVTRQRRMERIDKPFNNPGRRFPVHHEIQKLQEKLAAFNERIAELEDERSSGPCDGSAEGQRNRFRAADR
jgi:hypothetical protein